MKKLIFSALFLLSLLPVAAFAKDPLVTQAETWLNNLTTGQARFTQTAQGGETFGGMFYISRPGRLRFQYDAPLNDFIVADGTLLHYYDSEQRQASTSPIGMTLADFFLRKNTKLEGDLKVNNVRERAGMVSMDVMQVADPNAGQLTLNFTKVPFALKSWTILDAQGSRTTIILSDLKTGVPIPPALFVYKDPSGRTNLNK